MTFIRTSKRPGRPKLADSLSVDFTRKIRERGASYYSRGCVNIVRGSDVELEATVLGSQNYQVKMQGQDGELVASCDCPYFEGGEFCKHLWATILAADAGDYLSLPASNRDLVLVWEPDELEDDIPSPAKDHYSPSPRYAPPTQPPKPKPPSWQVQISGLSQVHQRRSASQLKWPANRQILYLVDVHRSAYTPDIVIAPMVWDTKADGSQKKLVYNPLRRDQIDQLPSAEDREILALLSGLSPSYGWGYGGGGERVAESFQVPYVLARKVLELAAKAGRCCMQPHAGSESFSTLTWDDGESWRFGMALQRVKNGGFEVVAMLERGNDHMELKDAILIKPGGLVFTRARVATLAKDTPVESLLHLQKVGPINAAEAELDGLLEALLNLPDLPLLELPQEIHIESVSPQPRASLRIHPARPTAGPSEKLRADLSFDYEGRQVAGHNRARGIYDTKGRRFIQRDAHAESTAHQLLIELGAKYYEPNYWETDARWQITPSKLPRMVRGLVEAGWHIEAEGKIFRRPGAFKLEVSSGVDWFELHGNVDYGETSAKLSELLEALRNGEAVVRLDDGTYGVLPEEWLKRFGLLAGLGTPNEGHIRFRRSQAGLLDALLASQPEATCDEIFSRVRQEIGQFTGVKASPQPDGFVGRLRDYQREGLGWMDFLRRFSFGGCLADDMGVGKTAQVLAVLEQRRVERSPGAPLGPSLIVVPRSLIFNWKQEAARFTPQLRVLDYTGLGRDSQSLADYDLILTTYGTLRRDVVQLKEVEFDYVVLDEAQAIKNAATEAAKAVRLLRGHHRLALSGTPVENHLGELWSLFEFLNPGMLGRASVFKLTGGAGRNPDDETRRLLAHALRPFILRRTKAQVAPELPSKSEQTIFCELEPAQRKLYDELRQHYRDSLLQRIKDEGLAKSKILVLEALLRLRQAACHPGLIDRKRSKEKSAKLDMLLDQLREVLDEGHKALVFSQFTSLLSIVRDRLDSDGVAHEYLDGQTRDRQATVERFQNDPDCRLFLISLKAGGLGLNLTAAEYVFLLDPWWNPAVEAQAVDRAHRIGQERQVFAYRLIARDTVEEKVLELQKTKRALAEAIIGADNSLIHNLRREDLELLLS